MSGLQSGASILELLGHEDSRALNLLGVLSAVMETWEKIDISSRSSPALLPLKNGSSGALVSAGAWLSGPVPLMLRGASLLSERPAKLRRLAACAGIAGSLLTRSGWVQAGKSSARDWRLPLAIEAPEKARKPKRWLFPGSRLTQPSSFTEKAKSAGAMLLLVGVCVFLILKSND